MTKAFVGETNMTPRGSYACMTQLFTSPFRSGGVTARQSTVSCGTVTVEEADDPDPIEPGPTPPDPIEPGPIPSPGDGELVPGVDDRIALGGGAALVLILLLLALR